MSAPSAIWQSLVRRSVFDIEAALHDARQREYLSNLDFLKSAAAQRDVELKKARVAQAFTALVTLYAVFVSADTQIDLELLGFKIKSIKLFTELLLALIAVGTFYSITYTLNVVLATLMIRAIFMHSGIKHFRYLIADKSISDLWANIMEVKLDGYASGWMHRIFLIIGGTVMLLGSLALPIVSVAIVSMLGGSLLGRNGLASASGLISAMSILIASASVFYFLVAFFVPFRFKFVGAERKLQE
jgi:hypothetical protein